MNYCFTVLKNEGKDKKEDEDWNGGVRGRRDERTKKRMDDRIFDVRYFILM